MHFFEDMKHSISNEYGELAIDEPIEFKIWWVEVQDPQKEDMSS